MTTITAIVADDESVARRRLVRMLEESGRVSVVAAPRSPTCRPINGATQRIFKTRRSFWRPVASNPCDRADIHDTRADELVFDS